MPGTKDIATRWLAAFNAHDIEGLLSLYDEHAVHYSPKLKLRVPKTKGLISGKSAMRDWWEGALKRFPSLHYKPVSITAGEDRVFMEYIRQVAGEEDIQVAEALDIKDGLIVSSRVYHS